LLELLADQALKKTEAVKSDQTVAPISPKVTRSIPVSIRRQIWRRDQYQCTYRDPTGRRCDSRRYLQVDHCLPFSAGGTHDPDNLRLVCGAHNRLAWDRWKAG
jgi:5-methylcytosine-specific restriction endonuclease McrA